MKVSSATASDVMSTDLVTVTPATSLTHFARLCIEDGISGCPVVTIDGRLEGIVSKTNLLARLLEGPQDGAPHGLMGLGEEGVSGNVNAMSESEVELYGQVQDIMVPNPVTVLPDAPLLEVARQMAEHRIHRVLVIEGGKVLGIITSLDLIANLAVSGG